MRALFTVLSMRRARCWAGVVLRVLVHRAQAPRGALLLLAVLLASCSRQPASTQMKSTASGQQSTLLVASSPDRTYSTRTYAKPGEAELKAKLEPLEYAVTQRDATEPAFQNR